MSDGSIKISVEVDGKQIEVTSKELDNLGKSGQDSGKGLKNAEDSVKGVGNESNKASLNIKKIATSLGLVAIGAAAFKTLKASMDDAISRFDTLNQFPKVLQALGVSAEDSEKAMDKLADGIEGLPTKLDDITSSTQELYTSFNDIDKATDTALALNNALLGSGANAEEAKRGTQQYIKALQTGQFDMMTWRTLSETMGLGLVKIAKEFGYAGDSAKNDLYKALQSGAVTIDDFNAKLIEVGTGTGEMAKLAKENSGGFATSIANLRNSVAKGIADIIKRFNELSKEITGKEIPDHIDNLKHIVNASFSTIGAVIEKTTPVVAIFASAVSSTVPVVKALTPAIIGLVTAYGAYTVISKASAAIEASNKVLLIAQASQKALTIATSAQMTAQVASTTATKADVVAKAAQTGAVKLSTLVIGAMTGTISLSTAAQAVATTATYAFGAALRFLTGPVGWIVTGVGALTAGITAVVKWFNKASEEEKALTEETSALAYSTKELNDELESNSKAHNESISGINSSAKANEDLIEKVQELAEKENKSASDKALLKTYTDKLNESVEGLNLSYSEQSDSLNMSNEEMQARVDLMKDEETLAESQERLVEITKERNEAEGKLDEINEKRAEWNVLLDEGGKKGKEAKEALGELDEQEKELTETHEKLGNEYEAVELQVTESMENMIEMVESGAISQSEMVDVWVEKNQELVDSMRDSYQEIYEVTTDAFDRINDESKVSAEEMLDNLKHNQEMMAEWGENISELMGFASEHGHENFLHWLENLGPDSAAEVAVISEMSDKELEEFANTMEKGADVSTEAFGKSLGEGMEESAEVLGEHITGLSETMQSQARDAEFEKVGEDIVAGYVEGITGSAGDAEKASKDMADGTTNAAKEALDSHSPSRVFIDIGAAPIGSSNKNSQKNSEKGLFLMRSSKFSKAVIVA